MALPEEEQMDAVFKSVRTDPVSGNEIPPGSLPEEVRDDIPAMLSEGEYVVPADVLRYYGVKFFEDLRDEAKMGMAEMEANGRIGGEPIEDEEDELPFSDEELLTEEDKEQEIESQMMASMGGVVGYQEGGFQPRIPKWMSALQGATPTMAGGVTFKTFVNSRGQEISVLVGPDNEPIFAIPAGYRLKEELLPEEIDKEEVEPAKAPEDDGTDYSSPTQEGSERFSPRYNLMTKEELEIALKASEEASKGNNDLLGLLGGPLLLWANKLSTKAEQDKIKEAIKGAYTKAEVEKGLRSGIDPKTGSKLTVAENDRFNQMIIEDNFNKFERETEEEQSRGSNTGVPLYEQIAYQTGAGNINVDALLPPTPTETTIPSVQGSSSFVDALKEDWQALKDFFSGNEEEDKP